MQPGESGSSVVRREPPVICLWERVQASAHEMALWVQGWGGGYKDAARVRA